MTEEQCKSMNRSMRACLSVDQAEAERAQLQSLEVPSSLLVS